ncbi:MAG: hypothetical protein AAFQ38_16640 [Pseudomonadota bacterium]
MLHMLRRQSDVSCEVEIGKDFPLVVDRLFGETSSRFIEKASNIWRTVIWNTVIVNVHVQRPELLDALDRNDKKFIESYLAALTQNTDATSKSKLSTHVAEAAESLSRGRFGIGAVLARFALDSEVELEPAKAIIESCLSQSGVNASVFIDTMEFYDVLESEAALQSLQGLLNCCTRLHHESDYLECRLFFPDELTEFAKSKSKSVAKDFRDIQHLSWSASELVCLAGLRLRDNIPATFPKGWDTVSLRLSDPKPAQELITKLIPSKITNSQGVTFETVEYILRHTQLTPRQVIMMLNWIFEDRFRISGTVLEPFETRMSESELLIRVHECAQEIYSDILATYGEIYPDIELLLSSLLPELGREFQNADLLEACKKCEIAETFGVIPERLKKILSDIGVVGIVTEKNDDVNTVVGRFSYRSWQRLVLSASHTFCVHPIFSSVHPPLIDDGLTVRPEGVSVYENFNG